MNHVVLAAAFLLLISFPAAALQQKDKPISLPTRSDLDRITVKQPSLVNWYTPESLLEALTCLIPGKGTYSTKALPFQRGTMVLKNGTVLRWTANSKTSLLISTDKREQLFVVSPKCVALGRVRNTKSSRSYVKLSIPELVMRSDVIVAAYVSEPTTHSCKLAVSETLLGTAQHEISITNTKSIPFREGAGGIFFLVSSKDHLTLVYPSAFKLDTLDDVRRVIEMRTSPSKYFADPHYASSPEFLEMIGLLFRDKQAVDGLSRQAAIDHLRDTLTSPNKDAVIRAVGALRALDSKDSAAVIPLLQHPDSAVRLLTAQFLTWAPDPAAVAPLCELLDGVNESSDPIEADIGRALIEIGDSSAVPALERATKRGVFGGTSWALGRLGDKKSFEILLEGVEKRDALDAVEGLMSLVRRSNKPSEAWMGVSSWTEQNGLEHKQDWLEWWKQNKSDFKVIMTAKEADGTE